MPRYNRINKVGTQSGAGGFATPNQGLFTTLTGTAPYTVTLADPVESHGIEQVFYNSTAGVITFSTPTGVIKGPAFSAAATQTIPANATYKITSDGVNYIISNNEGGPQAATELTVNSTLTTNGAVNLNPANATVSLSPSGSGTVTINPATAGTLNNVTIGNATAANATFNTVTVNTTIAGNGTIDGGTY